MQAAPYLVCGLLLIGALLPTRDNSSFICKLVLSHCLCSKFPDANFFMHAILARFIVSELSAMSQNIRYSVQSILAESYAFWCLYCFLSFWRSLESHWFKGRMTHLMSLSQGLKHSTDKLNLYGISFMFCLCLLRFLMISLYWDFECFPYLFGFSMKVNVEINICFCSTTCYFWFTSYIISAVR